MVHAELQHRGVAPATVPRMEMRTSQLLRSLVDAVEDEDASVGWLLEQLKRRAFGCALLIFALPNCLPMPPGIPTICGILLCILALQMIVGTERPWLPSFLARRRIARKHLELMAERGGAWIERLERLTQPRLQVLTGPIGFRLVGAVVFVLGIIMILPIPLLGNMPPAFATLIIAIGLTERDGLVVGLGLLGSVTALAPTGTLAIEAAAWAWQAMF